MLALRVRQPLVRSSWCLSGWDLDLERPVAASGYYLLAPVVSGEEESGLGELRWGQDLGGLSQGLEVLLFGARSGHIQSRIDDMPGFLFYGALKSTNRRKRICRVLCTLYNFLEQKG